MRTLADELLAALPEALADEPMGATVTWLAVHLSTSQATVRSAAAELDAQQRAVFMRYPGSRLMRLLPPEHDFRPYRVCAHCRSAFVPPKKSKRACCNRSCGIAWSWTRPGVSESRRAAIQAERQTEGAKERLRAHNERRWAKQEQRERLSEQNRREWADPAKGAKRAASIQAVNGSAEKRARMSENRKEMWKDPAYREKAIKALRASKADPDNRAKMSEALKRRWADPEKRAIMLAAIAGNLDKAMATNRGRKQTAEQVSKRMESTRKTKKPARPS